MEKRMNHALVFRLGMLAGLGLILAACPNSEEPRLRSGMMSERMPGMMADTPPAMMDRRMPMMEGMPEWMMSHEGMMGPQMMQQMRVIRRLLVNHEKIERQVEDIPGGVRTITRSDDPEVAELIRTHVRQMKERFEQDMPIRMMDPVFRELFEHRERAHLEYEEIPGGVRVTHTSEDPQVVLLIRQHAHRFVSEAAEQGMRRAMQPTPLPEGYHRDSGKDNQR
ncbi:hypothetical protein BH23GEM7_BH23GEM7_25020 [soil metagenome]|jgi:hypothetical protein